MATAKTSYIEFRTVYGKRRKSVVNFDDKNPASVSRTKQEFKDDADINVVVKRSTNRLGQPINIIEGMHVGDFSKIIDYQDALNQIKSAEKLFMELPAKTRKEFDNNPGEFLKFVSNPRNSDKMVELGLAELLPKKDVANQEPPAQNKQEVPKTSPNKGETTTS